MPLNRIPRELCALPQWVCAHADKVPKDPKTGRAASVSNPSTWGTFEQATTYAQQHSAHIGFVLSKADPYAVIDLDDKPDKPLTDAQRKLHLSIFDAFPSYAERSTSGRGLHIVVRGSIPSGVHGKDGVEVYSDTRFMIFTGDVVRALPIAEHQEGLNFLYAKLRAYSSPPVDLVDRESPLDDKELVEMAMGAANADKFNALCNGNWQALGYPSQSEADYALLSILAFYSPDNEQVRRLFRDSALGKREKAQRNDYLNRSLAKIRAAEPPRIDASALLENQRASPSVVPQVPPLPETPATTAPANEPYERPPGLVGDLADYFYRNAIRPTFEAALVAAIGFVAGIVGRQFNTYSGAGLNVYLILLARTGTGKEASKDGIDKLVHFIRPQVPSIADFIGPTAFASGQAIAKVIEKKPCCVAILGEFGHTLKQITSTRAHGWEIHLQKTLLNIYSRSGKGKMAGESVYASEEKNVKNVESPALTIVADSTPEVYFEAIEDEGCISSGLLPRFIPVEYQGDRPAPNERANCEPGKELVDRTAALASTALSMANGGNYVQVEPDAEAKARLDAFNSEADAAIRGSDEIHRHIWNRAHLHALKIATLLAVGDAPHAAIVKKMHAEWAVRFIRRSIQTNLRHYEQGEVGGGSRSKAEARVRKLIAKFINSTPDQRAKDYDKILLKMKTGPFIPRGYLSEHTRRVQPFKDDRHALDNILEALAKDGDLRKLPEDERNRRFPGNRKGEVFEVINWK